MVPKKYHAIIFICTLIMLLLLGLHLLGIGYGGSQADGAKSAALARNLTSSPSTSQASSSAMSNVVYRHPIIYDKLTGATNNQINDVLGAKQPISDYPLDHYQQQQQQQQSSQRQPMQFNNQLGQDDFFAGFPRQPPAPGQWPPPLGHHPLAHHLQPMMGPPPPPPPPPITPMTTQPPQLQPQQQQVRRPLQMGQPINGQNQRQSNELQSPSSDSLPSASSIAGQRPLANGNSNANEVDNGNPNNQPQTQQQPIYYTPPIFAYNNFDNNNNNNINPAQRQMLDPQLANQLNFNQQQPFSGPPLGVPEAPLSVDDYNARQTRLRQLNQQFQPINSPQEVSSQVDRYGRPGEFTAAPPQQAAPNLLADPHQQQRHKQQMLDRQLLFGNVQFPAESIGNQTNNANSYYPDPALYRSGLSSGPAASIRPPYATGAAPPQTRAEVEPQFGLKHQPSRPMPLPLLPPNQPVRAELSSMPPPPQTTASTIASTTPTTPTTTSSTSLPLCARQLIANELRQPELANSSSQLQATFCNEDTEYPTRDIMRALESYAAERSIEQLLPQPLVQLHLAQRNQQQDGQQQPINRQQLMLDPLQPTLTGKQPIGIEQQPSSGVSFDDQTRPNQQQNSIFPSANYEQMCRSTVYLAQPRRAKNVLGQWKVIANLPGHKYRGIAISQMVRIEECSRPNGECSAGRASPQLPVALVGKSRCLQQYENQRLVAWSNQQGLHLDIFRLPVTCSCHIRR